MEEILFCKGGGCTAKLGAGALSRVLSKLPKKKDDNLLVGFDASDDAAVYKLSDDIAMVQTLDFFPPMLEDPYIFGKIAATNALSDVYAMGGEVKTALNIVCFPESMDLNVLGKILQGGNEKVMEAGGVLAGGHSIVDTDVKYGLSVTGVVHPDKIWANQGAQVGDALILTKPLGVGIICTANRIKAASKEAMEKAIISMTTLNKYAAEVLRELNNACHNGQCDTGSLCNADSYAGADATGDLGTIVHACTDVTGFGFLVHLREMLGDSLAAEVYAENIPYFKECVGYIDEFYLTAAAQKNRNFMGADVTFMASDSAASDSATLDSVTSDSVVTSFATEEILFDPQTSGGLLVSVPYDKAEEVIEKLKSAGVVNSCIVGRIIDKESNKTKVTVKGVLKNGI